MQVMKDPATAAWGLSISDADYAKLKRGSLARDMDDKWAFIVLPEEEQLAEEAEAKRRDLADEPSAKKVEPELEEMTDEELTIAMEQDAVEEAEREAMRGKRPLLEGDSVSIRRSWTNTELYRLIVRSGEDGTSARIESVTWEQDQGERISEEQAKINIVLLCRSIAECELAAAPDYDPMLYL